MAAAIYAMALWNREGADPSTKMALTARASSTKRGLPPRALPRGQTPCSSGDTQLGQNTRFLGTTPKVFPPRSEVLSSFGGIHREFPHDRGFCHPALGNIHHQNRFRVWQMTQSLGQKTPMVAGAWHLNAHVKAHLACSLHQGGDCVPRPVSVAARLFGFSQALRTALRTLDCGE